MKPYSKNEKPYIYTAFPEKARDVAFETIETLSKDGVEFWYTDKFTRKEKKHIKGAFGVLLFVTKAYSDTDTFHAIVNEAVNCGKNILCVYLEDCEKTNWMKLQLGSQQSIAVSKSSEDISQKLKEAFIFKDMKVTAAQKVFQRDKALSFVLVPIIAALVLFYTVINPLLIAPNREVNNLAQKWGLTASDLESITELHIVGDQSFDSNVHAWYVDDGRNVAYYIGTRYQDHQQMDPIPAGSLTSEDLEILKLMPNLKCLQIEGQQITDISPIFDTNIESLSLNCNPITSLDGIEKMIQLRELVLVDNDISDISPVYALKNLQHLQIDGTYVSEIDDLSDLIYLTDLQITNSDITAIPYLGKKNRFILDLRGSHIYDLSGIRDVTSFKSFYYDDMGDCLTTQDVMAYLKEIPTENIGSTGVRSIDDIKDLNMYKHGYLGLAHNYLTSLEGIEIFEGIDGISLFYDDNMQCYLTDLTPLLRIKSLKRVELSPDMQGMAEEQLKDAHFEIAYRRGNGGR